MNVIEFICYFRQEDVLDTDLAQATAVVSFLVPRHLKLIKPKLGILKSLIQGFRTKHGLMDFFCKYHFVDERRLRSKSLFQIRPLN
jgi:hypothetical protein